MEIKKISLEEFNLRKRSILPPAYKDSTIVESKESKESKVTENCSEVQIPEEDQVEASIKRLKEAINNYKNSNDKDIEEIFK